MRLRKISLALASASRLRVSALSASSLVLDQTATFSLSRSIASSSTSSSPGTARLSSSSSSFLRSAFRDCRVVAQGDQARVCLAIFLLKSLGESSGGRHLSQAFAGRTQLTDDRQCGSQTLELPVLGPRTIAFLTALKRRRRRCAKLLVLGGISFSGQGSL